MKKNAIRYAIGLDKTVETLRELDRKRIERETIERCARVCEDTCGDWCPTSAYQRNKNPELPKHFCPCAKAIRSLLPASEKEKSG